jgi:streptogramin lyase
MRALLLFALTFVVLRGTAAGATIITLAGSGVKGFAGDGGLANDARLAEPTGLVYGPDGAIYFCDTGNHRIRKISAAGRIVTIAGTGEKGWSGDGGPALSAKLAEPYEVRFDRAGNLFWVERLSHTVRRLDSKTGVVTTIAGNGTAGFSGDSGPALKAQLNEPHSIGFDRAGDLYICDVKNHRIRKVTMATGIITTIAGTGKRERTSDDMPFATASLAGPRALDFDREGNLWLALREGNAIYKLDLAHGTIRHVAGTGQKGFSGDGGPAKTALFNGPKGIAVAPDGWIYIADTENHAIRRIDPKRGVIELVAGTGHRGDGPDGAAEVCSLNRPHGVFVAADGRVFLGDTEAQRIRVISAR